MANPRIVEWGSAPVLIKSTNTAGKITITARSNYGGTYAPAADTLTIESVPAAIPSCYTDKPTALRTVVISRTKNNSAQMTDEERRRVLEEVNRQQADFGVQ